MRALLLSNGMASLVDDVDYDWLNEWSWYAFFNGRKWYAVRHKPRPNRGILYMHRIILGDCCAGKEVDHRDNDGLNNQRFNLRVATSANNKHNRQKISRNTSGFKGVWWHKEGEKWCATINANGVRYYLGLFSDVREAAIAYNLAALQHHGEFALLNDVST